MRTLERTHALFLASAIAAAAVMGACSDDGTDGSGTGAAGQGGATTGTSSGDGGEGNTFSTGTTANDTLIVTPQDPVLDVEGAPETLQLTATLGDGSAPPGLTWEVDDVVVGTVSNAGLFQSNGLVAGVARVTARSGDLSASTDVTVRVSIVENPGNVSQTDQDLLTGGGNADAAFRWLYPYDATVFPRGLRAPVLQLGGAAADATYLKVSFEGFSYEGFFSGSNPVRIAPSQAIWEAITKSAPAAEPVIVEATKLSSGQVTGPVSETWKIAQGDFRGSVYYNTYASPLANGGAVMRVRPDVDASVLIGGCTVCHSVSANGNVLVGGVSWGSGNPLDSASFDLMADGTAPVRYGDADGRKLSFGGLTPNGELSMSNGVPGSGSPIRGLDGTFPSRLYDTATGAMVAAPSWDAAINYAITPNFAPDGSRIAFTWFENGGTKKLGMATFDGSQSPPVFGALEELVTATDDVAGWPSFVPDAGAVLFHDGEAFDTAGFGATPRYAELRLVETATKAVSSLAALNGRNTSGVYLPYGEGEEANLNYEPTVLPIAVGGYYWVVFTSRRAYGNTIAPGGTVAGGDNKWGEYVNGNEIPSVRKKLWVAAIDINYQGKPDPSHPAFYLGEQELEAGNMRAFVALDPCKDDGESCESGAECCNGFCQPTGETDEDGNPVLACGQGSGGCSQIDETCETAADCCDPSALCINGRCAVAPPE